MMLMQQGEIAGFDFDASGVAMMAHANLAYAERL
jgi:hypothetical protein